MLVIYDAEVTHNAGVVRDRSGAQPVHTFPSHAPPWGQPIGPICAVDEVFFKREC